MVYLPTFIHISPLKTTIHVGKYTVHPMDASWVSTSKTSQDLHENPITWWNCCSLGSVGILGFHDGQGCLSLAVLSLEVLVWLRRKKLPAFQAFQVFFVPYSQTCDFSRHSIEVPLRKLLQNGSPNATHFEPLIWDD